MQGPMLIALRRFTQLLRVHIYVPGCCKYIRMANGLQPLADLCMDGCCAGQSSHSRRFSPIAALARSYFCKIKSVTTSPVGPPKNWPEGGCVWGLKRQLWWQPNAIHDLPLLLIRDAPLLGIESLRV